MPRFSRRSQIANGMLIGSALFGLVWHLCGDFTSTSSSPRIEVGNSVYDLGEVPSGQSLTTSFVVRNVGAQRLVMLDVSNCCSQSDMTTTIIPAHSSERLQVVFTPPAAPGPIEYQRVFQTNDPQSPMVCLTLRARVRG